MANDSPKSAPKLRCVDAAVAAQLSRAFHAHTDVHPLLATLFAQLTALTRVCGYDYAYQGENVDLNYDFGAQSSHRARYRLQHEQRSLGEVTLYLREPGDATELETIEDLLSLAVVPLNDALDTRCTPAVARGADPHPAPGTPTDALLLVRMDNHCEVRRRDGEAWAQMLVEAILVQIQTGLRSTDSAYQIEGDSVAVLLPRTTGNQALEIATTLRGLIAQVQLTTATGAGGLRACFGIATTSGAATAEDVLEQAREALTAAEAAGSSQICLRCASSG